MITPSGSPIRAWAPSLAAARLFAQRFPSDPAPSAPGTVIASLVEAQTEAPTEITDLAARRLDAVKGTLKRAGIDAARLPETKPVQREGRDGQVEANVLEPETPQPSKVREVFKRLGVPLKNSGAAQ